MPEKCYILEDGESQIIGNANLPEVPCLIYTENSTGRRIVAPLDLRDCEELRIVWNGKQFSHSWVRITEEVVDGQD